LFLLICVTISEPKSLVLLKAREISVLRDNQTHDLMKILMPVKNSLDD